MFIGRQQELKELERLYNTDKFQCAIIYGRRRVGKTALINEFVKGKETAYFTGQETNSKENLEAFSHSIFALSQDFGKASPSFSSYKEALGAVFDIAEKRKIILVIDEYPYLAGSYKGISSLLQTFIDKYKETSKIFIILCGSSLSFMENQVLGYKSPLFGRRTAQFKILPFEFTQVREYFKDSGFDIYDTAVLYGITGGIPLYLSLIDKKLSLKENIKFNFLMPSAYLFEEPGNLIKQECREPARYNAIIKAIATGSTRLSEISSKAGLESGLCSAYISKLISIGIVKKEHPFGEENSKKAIYILEDSMFKFWYRFIPNQISVIQRGAADEAYAEIENQIPAYMGSVFEEICKQYLWRLNLEKKSVIPFISAGRWWGNNPEKREETEIDIVACKNKDDAIFAECKWTNEKIGADVLGTLIDRSNLFKFKNKYYYLFSKKGFTSGCMQKAENIGNVFLVSFADMF